MISFSIDKLNEELIEKIQPLLEENHAVSGQFEELDIFWEAYLQLSNSIIVICMKNDEEMVGILIFLIGPYPHNKNQIFGEQLTFFIQREHRIHAEKMLELSETVLAGYGCEFVIQSARYKSSFCNVLSKLGYDPLDMKYTKRLV